MCAPMRLISVYPYVDGTNMELNAKIAMHSVEDALVELGMTVYTAPSHQQPQR